MLKKESYTKRKKSEKEEIMTQERDSNTQKAKNAEWIEWRQAKKEERLSEHRHMLRSSVYRQAKKRQANRDDLTIQR